jgi:Matrixin
MRILRLAAALVIGAVVVGGPLASLAQAGSVTSSAAVPAGYKFHTVKLASGKKAVVRWNPCQKAITYRVNLKGLAKAKRAAMLKQVKTAFAELSAADGITYRYAGATTFIPKSGNLAKEPAEIVVAAASAKATDLGLTQNVLGVGGVMWTSWSGGAGQGVVVTRGFVVLSPTEMNSIKPGFGKGVTQGNVILHELGHATGLEHVSSKTEIMNPTLTASTPKGYGRGDLAGLKKIGIKGGCVTVPSGVRVPDLS